MNTKDYIEFLESQKKESGFLENIEKFNKQIDEIIKYLLMWEELRTSNSKLTPYELEQKYFPKQEIKGGKIMDFKDKKRVINKMKGVIKRGKENKWLNTPNEELKNKTPLEIMSEDPKGIEIILNLLHNIEWGMPT